MRENLPRIQWHSRVTVPRGDANKLRIEHLEKAMRSFGTQPRQGKKGAVIAVRIRPLEEFDYFQ